MAAFLPEFDGFAHGANKVAEHTAALDAEPLFTLVEQARAPARARGAHFVLTEGLHFTDAVTPRRLRPLHRRQIGPRGGLPRHVARRHPEGASGRGLRMQRSPVHARQGGILPSFHGHTYLSLLRAAKEKTPAMHVHAFSPL